MNYILSHSVYRWLDIARNPRISIGLRKWRGPLIISTIICLISGHTKTGGQLSHDTSHLRCCSMVQFYTKPRVWLHGVCFNIFKCKVSESLDYAVFYLHETAESDHGRLWVHGVESMPDAKECARLNHLRSGFSCAYQVSSWERR